MAKKNAEVVESLKNQVLKLEAEVRFHKDREEYFARALHVTDGGQYRADWGSRIQNLIDSNKALAGENANLQAANENLLKKSDKASNELLDQCRISMIAMDALEKLGIRDIGSPYFDAQVIYAAYRLGRLKWDGR